MGMTDPIADLLTRIRNAYSARHDKVTIPLSTMKESILNVLKKEYNQEYNKEKSIYEIQTMHRHT